MLADSANSGLSVGWLIGEEEVREETVVSETYTCLRDIVTEPRACQTIKFSPRVVDVQSAGLPGRMRFPPKPLLQLFGRAPSEILVGFARKQGFEMPEPKRQAAPCPALAGYQYVLVVPLFATTSYGPYSQDKEAKMLYGVKVLAQIMGNRRGRYRYGGN